jgi:hypothetical protein
MNLFFFHLFFRWNVSPQESSSFLVNKKKLALFLFPLRDGLNYLMKQSLQQRNHALIKPLQTSNFALIFSFPLFASSLLMFCFVFFL